MVRRLIGLLSVTLLLPVTSTHAALIWQDEFARPSDSSVGNGWLEIEDDDDDVAIIFGNRLRLRDNGPGAAATRSGISTLGFENIIVEFRWRPRRAEAAGRLSFAYRAFTDSRWSTVFNRGLGGPETYRTELIELADSADNASELAIAFELDVNHRKDAVQIDYVRFYGAAYSEIGKPTGIPEPTTFTLTGLSLLGLGIGVGIVAIERTRRRR